ncbi:hypothetical protein EXW96_12420 [Paenibacillus sp. JMULE4]|nr:hypothetical protein [Paenibacillus sp. JMULE4]
MYCKYFKIHESIEVGEDLWGFLFIVIVLVIGFAGIFAGMISNQYSMLRRMERMEEVLREINDKLKK